MRERLQLVVTGAVQGVGFRPFVYRVARDLSLDGWVVNSPQGVFVEVEGDRDALTACLDRISHDGPPLAIIKGLEARWLDAVPYRGFEIRDSVCAGETTALVLPDVATCEECRREVFDPANRRYRYPFTNCTNCGPRFSLIDALPYDRSLTSMRRFRMCPACQREYDDPGDRRFHAQPNACPACGPQAALWDSHGRVLADRDEALVLAAAAIRAGRIVAVKGLGGFHLVVDAANQAAVERLRARKHRGEKPLALMYPDLAGVEHDAYVSPLEAQLLASPASPIVLLRRRQSHEQALAASIAPGNPYLGVMLSYTPLHHLLLAAIGRPVVATSGNLSDEPICTDEREALDRLRGIADDFLVHDRPIVRPVDDSIVHVVVGREQVLRRARGYAPLPVTLPAGLSGAGGPADSILAVGAHLKNTVAVTVGANVFISQHLGDLETPESSAAFRAALGSLSALYHVTPSAVVADLHPDYLSTKYARDLHVPLTQVQHHYAHVLSCMADNDLDGCALGVSWDGTGYGPDGTIWGGEFLSVDDATFTRLGCLRPFRLPGGDRAIREPRRSAFGLLHAMAGDAIASMDLAPVRAFDPVERDVLLRALSRGVNAPVTTSAGRLFDAVASLCGLRQRSTFEGQAAMDLEFAAAELDESEADPYPFSIGAPVESAALDRRAEPPVVVDWEPMIREVIDDAGTGVPTSMIAARLHATLAAMIVAVAVRAGEPIVILTGGCFQNRVLTSVVVARLRRAGFRPYWHRRVPPNDGGISLGQIVAHLRGVRAGREQSRDAAVSGW